MPSIVFPVWAEVEKLAMATGDILQNDDLFTEC